MNRNEFDLFQKRHFRKVQKRQLNWLTQNPYIVEKEKQLLLAILKTKPKKILEVGCGEGANIVNLKKFGFKGKITGVDFSQAKIAFAKKQAPFAQLIKADAYHLPFRQGEFDLVFCKNLLHHLSNQEKAVSEMVRVCRAGGRVIVIEGNGKNFLNFFLGSLFRAERNLLKSTPEKMTELIESGNFLKIEKILLSEPFNLFRALFHYRFGCPRAVCSGKFWLKIDNFFAKFIPQSQYGYIIITARKINQKFLLK